MYKCIFYNDENKKKKITLDIDSKEEVIKYANENNMRIISVKEVQAFFSRRKLKDKELKVFSKEISILLKSGCDISNILDILKKQSNHKTKKVIETISNNIEKGNSITESFESTKAFSRFYISMLKAGEVSGRLDEVMDKLSTFYDKESKLKSKIFSILIYPVILIIAMIISFSFILVFLVPSFEDIYIDNAMKTPLITKILIILSHIVRDYFLIIVLIHICIVGGFIYLNRNNHKVKEVVNRWSFTLPIISTYSKLIITNKFSKALSVLMWSGIHIVEAIDISAKVICNDFVYEKICMANESIKRGNSIGDSLKIIDEFPELFISMMVIGEESGRLDIILDTINDYYENEIDTKMELGTKYFENIIILFIGLIVGVTVISMVVPMFDAVSSI